MSNADADVCAAASTFDTWVSPMIACALPKMHADQYCHMCCPALCHTWANLINPLPRSRASGQFYFFFFNGPLTEPIQQFKNELVSTWSLAGGIVVKRCAPRQKVLTVRETVYLPECYSCVHVKTVSSVEGHERLDIMFALWDEVHRAGFSKKVLICGVPNGTAYAATHCRDFEVVTKSSQFSSSLIITYFVCTLVHT